jgi:hypothetical protein
VLNDAITAVMLPQCERVPSEVHKTAKNQRAKQANKLVLQFAIRLTTALCVLRDSCLYTHTRQYICMYVTTIGHLSGCHGEQLRRVEIQLTLF